MKITVILLSLCLSAAAFAQKEITFKRFTENPIITPAQLGEDGENINGPSLIKVPDWVPNRLGKYYLYFAHHQGEYIRLAYADDLRGPWKIYKPGTLRTTDCRCREAAGKPATSSAGELYLSTAHIASPDVHIDELRKQLVLYFHCPLSHEGKKGQYTLRATSGDGIRFNPDTTVLGQSYMRVFHWKGKEYGIARAGDLYRSSDGGLTFEEGPNPFDKIQNKTNYLRHGAVKVVGDKLLVFYSRIGDKPERILLSEISLADDWNKWKPTEPVLIAEPATPYEGVDLPLTVSKAGSFHGLIRELRDPAFYEEDGKWYLLYSVAGESGIAIGELHHK